MTPGQSTDPPRSAMSPISRQHRRLAERGPVLATVLLGAVIVAGTVACAPTARTTPNAPVNPAPSTASPAPGATAAPSLPPRPVALPLNGVQPCALLVGAGARALGVQPGIPSGRPESGNAQCQWANYAVVPNDTWMALALLNRPAGAALTGSAAAQVVEVAGFPAVQTNAQPAIRDRACELYVDVAPGQSLLVRYLNGATGNPAMTRALACQKAHRAAELMVGQLRALAHRPG